MNGAIYVIRQTEEAFKKACRELDIEYRCIGEGQDGDRYLLTFDAITDIYALGQMVGADSLLEFQRSNKDI